MTKHPDGSIDLLLPPGVARWTMSGKANAEEVWAFDWWTQPGVGVASAAAWQSTVDAMEGLCRSTGLYGAIAGCLPAAGGPTEVKGIYYRNTQLATYVAAHATNPAVIGTSAANSPLQMSFCITTLTDIPGRSTRGRMYLPATGLTLDANRRLNAATVAPIVDKVRLILAAGNVDGQYGPPVVVSKVLTIATKITSVRYDLKPDIQRRRSNRQSDGGRTTVAV